MIYHKRKSFYREQGMKNFFLYSWSIKNLHLQKKSNYLVVKLLLFFFFYIKEKIVIFNLFSHFQ